MTNSKTLNKLIIELNKFPGIGPKSAQKLAFHILQKEKEEIQNLTSAIWQAKEDITYCKICFNITDISPCAICEDTQRKKDIICVVEEARDIIAIEKTKKYPGVYHVLQGILSPLDGIGPENLRIKEMLTRIIENNISEIILAISPTVEGEATMIYLSKILKGKHAKITRLCCGLPVGANVNYADEVTLTYALEGRTEIKQEE